MANSARLSYNALVKPVYRSTHPEQMGKLFKLVLDDRGLRAYDLEAQTISAQVPVDDLSWLEETHIRDLTSYEQGLVSKFERATHSHIPILPRIACGKNSIVLHPSEEAAQSQASTTENLTEGLRALPLIMDRRGE